MRGSFNVVFPPRGRQKFDGGLNNKFECSIIADNESPDCLNVVFTNGAVETRGGTTKLNTTAIGSFVGDGLYTRHDTTVAETMIAWAGGTAYAWTGVTFATIGSAQSVFTAGVRVGAAEMENHIFFGNGTARYKWNGTAFTRHGVPLASGPLSVSTTAAGLLIGDQSYKVLYVNSQAVEGDVSTAITYTGAASSTFRISNIPVAPQSHGVAQRRLYRYDGTSYKRLTTINDNTTTTYDDNIATSALGTAAPSDQGEPPTYSIIVQHQNRMFMNDPANPNYVWYTELYEPYTVKATNFQAFGDASLDLVRGIHVYNQGLIIEGDVNLYYWYMPSASPTDWRVLQIRSGFGSKSPFAGALYNNKLLVPVMQSGKFVGMAAIAGTTMDPDATIMDTQRAGSDLKSDRIEPDMFAVADAYVAGISAQVFKNKAYIALPYGDTATANNRVYAFDFSRTNLSQQEASWVPFTGLSAAQFTVYSGKVYAIDSTATGFVRQLETSTYNDDGTAINSYFWTKEFGGLPGHENLEKDFRFVRILVQMSGAFYMTVRWRVDSDSGDGTSTQVYLNPGSSIWGTLIWGAGVWGGGVNQREFTIPLSGARGKRIQFQFSNQNAANQSFKVHGLNFTYNIKGRR